MVTFTKAIEVKVRRGDWNALSRWMRSRPSSALLQGFTPDSSYTGSAHTEMAPSIERLAHQSAMHTVANL